MATQDEIARKLAAAIMASQPKIRQASNAIAISQGGNTVEIGRAAQPLGVTREIR